MTSKTATADHRAAAEERPTASTMASSPVIIKAVLFDLDGTLLDTEALSDRANLQAFVHFGIPVPKHLFEDNRLPWSIKKQILGLPGHQWVPMVLQYAKEHWIKSESNDEGKSHFQLPSV